MAAITNWRGRAIRVAIIAVAISLIASPALAYIDPNAGGMLFQILTPVLAILAIGYRTIKRKLVQAGNWLVNAVKTWVGRPPSKKDAGS